MILNNPVDSKIYEFSTGIIPDIAEDGSWFSRGFTENYMNLSFPGGKIPHEVERAIANELFAVVEGQETDKPAIIGRVIPGSPGYSVVALVSRGKDKNNRFISLHRYFICEGQYHLSEILAWLRDYQQQHGQLPVFNPLDRKKEGDYYSPPDDYQPPNMTLDAAGERLIAQDTPILIQGEQFNFHQVNILAFNKAAKEDKPVSWAYNVEMLEKPTRFAIIHAVGQDAYKKIQRVINSPRQELTDVGIEDEKYLEFAIKSIVTSSRMKPEWVRVIAEVINNEQVTAEYWHQLFNNEGANRAANISSTFMARLLTLRAMVIPESLPNFLEWINIKRNRVHKQASLIFQSLFYNSFPQELLEALQNKLGQGIAFVLEKMLEMQFKPETLVELVQAEGSAWSNCSQSLIQNIADDFYYIASLTDLQKSQIFKKINSGEAVDELKCNPVVWQRLLDGYNFKASDRKRIKEDLKIYDLTYYRPLAQFLEKFGNISLAAYFYQISQGNVQNEIFIKVFRQVLRRNNSYLSSAKDWIIRRKIYEKDYQIKFPSIILKQQLIWKDLVIILINSPEIVFNKSKLILSSLLRLLGILFLVLLIGWPPRLFPLLAGIISALIGWSLGELFATDFHLLEQQQMKEVVIFPFITISLAMGMVLNEIFISTPTRPKLCWRKAFLPLFMPLPSAPIPIALMLGTVLGLMAGLVSQLLYLPYNFIQPWIVRTLSWLLIGLSVGLAEGLTWLWLSIEARGQQRFFVSIGGGITASILAALLFESIRNDANLPILFRQFEDPIGFTLLGLLLGLAFAITNSPSYLAALRAGEGFEYTYLIINNPPPIIDRSSNLKFVSDYGEDKIEEGLSIQLPGKGTITIGSDGKKAQIVLPGIADRAAEISLLGREAKLRPRAQPYQAIALNGSKLTSSREITLKHNDFLTFYTITDDGRIDEEKIYRFVFYNRFLDPEA